MLDALRQTPGASVSSDPTAFVEPVGVASAPLPSPLPDVVAAACEQYGFGDREEISRNYRRAQELHAAGRDPHVIVREIRQGADVTGLFV